MFFSDFFFFFFFFLRCFEPRISLRPLSLICLIFIMPFSTNVTKPMRLYSHSLYIRTGLALLSHSRIAFCVQGQSQWVVLKSEPNKIQIRRRHTKTGAAKESWKKNCFTSSTSTIQKSVQALKKPKITYTSYCHLNSARFQSISSKQSQLPILILSK